MHSRTFSVFLEKFPPRNVQNIPRAEESVSSILQSAERDALQSVPLSFLPFPSTSLFLFIPFYHLWILFFLFIFFFISFHSSFSEFPVLQNIDPTYLEYFENLHLSNKTNFNLSEYLNHKQLYLHSSVSFASNTLTKLMALRNTR